MCLPEGPVQVAGEPPFWRGFFYQEKDETYQSHYGIPTCPSSKQNVERERESEREQSSFSNEVKHVRLKYSQMKGWMVCKVSNRNEMSAFQKKCRAFRREFLQRLLDYDLEHVLQELYRFHKVIC